MGEVKWIKITTSMFDDEKIKIIESMPDADSILVIWIKLLTLAGKNNSNGFIFLAENIPYTDEMLSTLFNRQLNTVRLALQTFKQFKMIDFDESNFLYLVNWDKHQNIEGLDKIREQTKKRVSDYRERKSLALTVGSAIDSCAYCGREANTIDHIIPKSKGGEDRDYNIVPCCKSCNSSKKDKDVAEFLTDSFFYSYQKVNHNLVRGNSKVMAFVDYCDAKYTMKCNVTVTHGNALDIEGDIDKKESKKKPKTEKPIKNLYGEFVSLTEKEYESLTLKYGADLPRMIEILDNYLGQNEKNLKRYTSHNHVLRGWVINQLAEEKEKAKPKPQFKSKYQAEGLSPAAILNGGGNKFFDG